MILRCSEAVAIRIASECILTSVNGLYGLVELTHTFLEFAGALLQDLQRTLEVFNLWNQLIHAFDIHESR